MTRGRLNEREADEPRRLHRSAVPVPQRDRPADPALLHVSRDGDLGSRAFQANALQARAGNAAVQRLVAGRPVGRWADAATLTRTHAEGAPAVRAGWLDDDEEAAAGDGGGGTSSIGEQAGAAWDAGSQAVGDAVESVGAGAESVGEAVYGGAESVGEAVYGGAESVGEAVYGGAESVGEAVYGGAESVGEAAGDATDWVAEQVGGAWDATTGVIDDVASGVGEAVGGAVDWASEQVDQLVGGIGDLAEGGFDPASALGDLAGGEQAEEQGPGGAGKSYTKVGPPSNSSYSVSGDLDAVAATVNARKEAGSVTTQITSQDFDTRDKGGPGEKVVAARIDVSQVMELPVWTDKSKAPAKMQAEWDRFSAALAAHEAGHVQKDVTGFAGAHQKAIGKNEADADAAITTVSTNTNTANDAYDVATDHGRNTGTRLQTNLGQVIKVP